jgi:hypothetical protein
MHQDRSSHVEDQTSVNSPAFMRGSRIAAGISNATKYRGSVVDRVADIVFFAIRRSLE